MEKNRLNVMTTPWVSVSDVALALGVSRKTVLRYCAEGKLKAIKLGQRTIRIDPESVEAFAVSYKEEARSLGLLAA